MAPGTFFIRIESATPLSADEVNRLGKKSAMYLMTEVWDMTDRLLMESCFRTEPNSQALTFCVDHNK